MESKKFGVIGNPIEHSMSAVMHNAAFKQLELPHTYELFNVLPENLGSFIKNNKELSGINVTIPHKVEVIKHLDSLDKTAGLVGAVNTVKFNKENKGYTTDGIGCVKALQEQGVELKNKKILILGAGGAARSIIFPLIQQGAKISITNRTKEKAESLAEYVKKKIGIKVNLIEFEQDKLKNTLADTDILINATSVGMYPKTDDIPIPAEILNSKLTVMDLVYNPVKTRLLKSAEEIGCKIVPGVGMLVHQGAESFKIWLAIEPPVEVMRKAILEKLEN